MWFRNKLENFLDISKEHFLMPFFGVSFLIFLVIYIFNIKALYLNNLFILAISFICLFFYFYSWYESFKKEGRKKNLFFEFSYFFFVPTISLLLIINCFHLLDSKLLLYTNVFLIFAATTSIYISLNTSSANSFLSNLSESKNYIYLLGLIVIVVLGFITRLYIGEVTNPDLDEGQLVYDSKLVGEGLIPFKDFTTRAPLLVYLLLAINKILFSGFYLMSSKILIAALFSVASIGIYFLSKELYDSKKTALLSTLLFNLAPFYLFYSTALHVAQGSIVFLIFFCLFSVKFIKTNQIKYIFISGLILGIGYLVRRDLIMYTVFLCAFVIISNYFQQKRFIDSIKEMLVFSSGFVLGLSPLLYFVFQTNIFWIDKFYGLSSLIGQTVGREISTATTNKWPIFYSFLLCNSIFIFTYFRSFINSFLKNDRYAKFFYSVLCLTLFYLALNINPLFKTGGYSIYSSFLSFFIISMGFIYSFSLVGFANYGKEIGNRYVLAFIHFIFLFYYFILFIFLKEFNTNYFLATLFIPIIITSNFFVTGIKRFYQKGNFIFFLSTLLLIFILILNIDVFKSYKYERSWSREEIGQVNSFLKNNVDDELIFSVGITLVLDSQKDVVFDITHHRVYDTIKCYEDDPFPTLRCLDDLGRLLEIQAIKYIVGDQRTMGLINGYDKLKEPFEKNYEPLEVVSTSITIFGLKEVNP